MTGGMDNPVGIAFMPDGERILSGTFFAVNPRHDGLIHAIYGGVYGKENGVLEGHPRTGELMPILDPLERRRRLRTRALRFRRVRARISRQPVSLPVQSAQSFAAHFATAG